MAEVSTTPFTGKCAIVTGANKGIGFETCRQLAAKGITVVLTARDKKKGREAVEKLRKKDGVDDRVLFHQLEVTDPASVASLVDFTKATFGKLDILINNAGVAGVTLVGDVSAFKKSVEEVGIRAGLLDDHHEEESQEKAKGTIIKTYELGEECLQINYYGAKRMTEAFIPLLQLSDSPRIVNVSSSNGLLQVQTNEWARGVLSDVESLTEEKIDEVLNEFLKDFKQDSLQAKDWPQSFSAYSLSKAAMNAYTRIIAKKYPAIIINAVCPGYVKTGGNYYTGELSVEEGAASPVNLALLPDGGPSGLFFVREKISSF